MVAIALSLLTLLAFDRPGLTLAGPRQVRVTLT
jgi:hypothetical protein